jgi:hypothetical protein
MTNDCSVDSYVIEFLRSCWFWPREAPATNLIQALTPDHRAALFTRYCQGRGDESQKPCEHTAEAMRDLQTWGFITSSGLTEAGERMYRYLVSTAQD